MGRRRTPGLDLKVTDALEINMQPLERVEKSEPRRIGRPPVKPSVDDPSALELLCEHLVAGMSLASACADPNCPAERQVYLKMAKDGEFCRVIGRAREAQQHAIIDQTVDMADAATPENWQIVRLRIWARQWRAAKLAPKVYGDKTETTHKADPENPLVVEHRAAMRAELIRRLDAMAVPEPLVTSRD